MLLKNSRCCESAIESARFSLKKWLTSHRHQSFYETLRTNSPQKLNSSYKCPEFQLQGLLHKILGSSNLTPPVATAYLQTVLIPSNKEKMGIRLAREMKTLAAIVDEIARGVPEVGADIASQRLKALELQMTDGGWQRAQFIELIAPEGAGLAERAEQYMAAREQANEAKMRLIVGGQRPPSQWQSHDGKGKGDQKGKSKGKKGGKKGWQQTWTEPAAPDKAPPGWRNQMSR